MLEQGISASNVENAGYKRTISEKGIKSINKELYNSSLHSTCGMNCLISQEEFQEDKTEIGIMPCGHYFEYDQLKLWLIEKPECPLCRYEMDYDEIKIGQANMDNITNMDNTINNALNTFPTRSNLLNHMLLLGQLENN